MGESSGSRKKKKKKRKHKHERSARERTHGLAIGTANGLAIGTGDMTGLDRSLEPRTPTSPIGLGFGLNPRSSVSLGSVSGGKKGGSSNASSSAMGLDPDNVFAVAFSWPPAGAFRVVELEQVFSSGRLELASGDPAPGLDGENTVARVKASPVDAFQSFQMAWSPAGESALAAAADLAADDSVSEFNEVSHESLTLVELSGFRTHSASTPGKSTPALPPNLKMAFLVSSASGAFFAATDVSHALAQSFMSFKRSPDAKRGMATNLNLMRRAWKKQAISGLTSFWTNMVAGWTTTPTRSSLNREETYMGSELDDHAVHDQVLETLDVLHDAQEAYVEQHDTTPLIVPRRQPPDWGLYFSSSSQLDITYQVTHLEDHAKSILFDPDLPFKDAYEAIVMKLRPQAQATSPSFRELDAVRATVIDTIDTQSDKATLLPHCVTTTRTEELVATSMAHPDLMFSSSRVLYKRWVFIPSLVIHAASAANVSGNLTRHSSVTSDSSFGFNATHSSDDAFSVPSHTFPEEIPVTAAIIQAFRASADLVSERSLLRLATPTPTPTS